MKFLKLILFNFSSFYKEHVITFHTTDEKTVSIITGGSGYGKTSIFDAINWALYGKDYEFILKKQCQKDILDYINETALKEARLSNNSVEMSSTLFFEHEGIKYRIQQAICVRDDNNKLEETDRITTLLKLHPDGHSSNLTFIDSFLNEILPKNVRDYFLFNGDRINELSLPGSSNEIKDGIRRVVDLEILESGINHLKGVAETYRKLAKANATGESEIIENEYDELCEKKEQLEEEIVNLNDQKRSAENNIEIINSKLKEIKEVVDLQTKRDLLQNSYKIKLSELEKTISYLREAASFAIMGIELPTLIKHFAELDEKRDKGEIPSNISESLLEDILKIGTCICGTSFQENDTVYLRLKQRLEDEREKKDEGNKLLDLYYGLKGVINKIPKETEEIVSLEKKRTQIEQELVGLSKELEYIMDQLKSHPEEEITSLARELEKRYDDLLNYQSNIEKDQKYLREIEEKIQVLKIKRAKLGEQKIKLKQFQLREELALKSVEELTKIFDQFTNESRIEIQKLTSEEFVKFIPNASGFNIAISPEFHYDVRDGYGRPALQQLSNGQRQALSLAYITAISRVSEKNPPLVIDMPFGRLDESVQENIAARLPELASQVILLMLPGTEWNEKTRAILYGKTADIYSLTFDSEKRQSEIEKEK